MNEILEFLDFLLLLTVEEKIKWVWNANNYYSTYSEKIRITSCSLIINNHYEITSTNYPVLRDKIDRLYSEVSFRDSPNHDNILEDINEIIVKADIS